MGTYPFLVDVAWKVVEKLVQDWQQNPFLFERERDIQSELYSRLVTAYRLQGMETVEANYDEYKHLKMPQKWGRVSCEPKIIYDWQSKDDALCRPDVVVWKDIDKKKSPPDIEDNVNFPMMWACEIKYRGRQRPLSSEDLMNLAKKDGDWDLRKIRDLLGRNDLDYGCALYLSWSRTSGTGTGLCWEKDEVDGRLWICAAQLPPISNS